MKVAVTEQAEEDLAELPREVEETFMAKIGSVEKNLELGAEPGQAFGKYLSGNMHPVLQMNLGRDYRAWFIEGVYAGELENDTVYAWRVLTKREAKKLAGRIVNPLEMFRSSSG